MALIDEDAAQVAAEEALRAVGVHDEHLDRAVLMLGIVPGDTFRYAKGEAEALLRDLPWLAAAPGASSEPKPHDGKAVERGRAKAAELGWTAPPGEQDNTRSGVQRRGRAKAAELGWIK